jgi:hypothetical protein
MGTSEHEKGLQRVFEEKESSDSSRMSLSR